jgi:topoisomerase (DNA) II binding protein 1
MSGEVSKDFHQNVTHLVAGEVGSKKYLVAAKLKKKIMSPEWVEQVWEAAKSAYVQL